MGALSNYIGGSIIGIGYSTKVISFGKWEAISSSLIGKSKSKSWIGVDYSSCCWLGWWENGGGVTFYC